MPGMLGFKIWETVEPPPGTVYNYPIRPWHNAKPSLTAAEASPDIAVQIYNRAIHNQMMARLQAGPDDSAGDRLGAGRTGRLHALSSFERNGSRGWRWAHRTPAAA